MKNIDRFSYSKNYEEKREIEEGIDEFQKERRTDGGELEVESETSNDDPDGAEENFAHAELPSGLVDPGQFLDQDGHEKVNSIYDYYSKAMNKRGREPLEEDRFVYHFFENGSYDQPCMFGDYARGFIMGSYTKDLFIPTHFAPKSMRSGYNLFKELGNSPIPTVMFITEDLADTLQKMPEWKIEDLEIPGNFRGQEIKKRVAHNRFPGYEEKLLGMAKGYLSH